MSGKSVLIVSSTRRPVTLVRVVGCGETYGVSASFGTRLSISLGDRLMNLPQEIFTMRVLRDLAVNSVYLLDMENGLDTNNEEPVFLLEFITEVSFEEVNDFTVHSCDQLVAALEVLASNWGPICWSFETN